MSDFFSPYVILVISLLALYAGPLSQRLFRSKIGILRLIDGFTLVIILELVLVHILPHTFYDVGPLAILFIFIGLFLPTTFERIYKKFADQAHNVAMVLAMIGLVIHTLTDGIALINPIAMQHGVSQSQNLLPLAIIMHRLPEGLAIWWLIRPEYGNKKVLLMLLVMSLATLAGFFAGQSFIPQMEHRFFGLFEALVAGSLLHVLLHRHDKYILEEKQGAWKYAPGLGALLGIALIVLIYFTQSGYHEEIIKPFEIFFVLAKESAPALVIGYVIAGLIEPFMPAKAVHWMKRGGHLSQSLRGMAFGLPLPVCSCGVVPIYRGLIKQGLPLSAAIAFFVATPELGIDAFLLSVPLLGSHMAFIRLAAAAIVALIIGWVIGILYDKKTVSGEEIIPENKFYHLKFLDKLKFGFKTGLEDVVDHTAPWIIVGLSIAAIAEPLLSETTFFTSLPNFLQIVFFASLGMPIYVCASGATPIVAILLATGISPGAALAFLLTGPATNVTTFAVLAKLHGRKVAFTFALAMAVLAVLAGLVVNWIHPTLNQNLKLGLHEHGSNPVQTAALILICVIYAASILRRGPRYLINQIVAFESENKEKNTETASKHDHCCG